MEEKNILVQKSCDVCQHQNYTVCGPCCDKEVNVEMVVDFCGHFELAKWLEPKEEINE